MEIKNEVGRRYYFIIHAYHHIVADVVKILGTRHVLVKNCHWIYRSELGWDEFFKQGFTKENTTYREFPDGDFVYIAKFEFDHKFPGEE